MRRIRFVQYSMIFVMLIGLLSVNAGIHQDDATIIAFRNGGSDTVEQLTVVESASMAEQELVINQLVWSKIYPSLYDDWGRQVTECENGDYCILGTLDFNGNWDTVLIRIDSSGNQIWNRTFGYPDPDSGSSVIQCSDGGFAVAGQRMNNTMYGLDGGWLVKTNSTGHHQWNVTYYEALILEDLVQTDDGGFILVGDGSPNPELESDIVVIKTAENGTRLWAGYYGSYEYELGLSIIQCTSGGFAITGAVKAPGGADWETILMRISDTGILLWYRTYSNNHSLSARCLVECDNGDFLVGGYDGLLRTDSTGHIKEAYYFSITPADAVLFDDNRIALTGSKRLVWTDENAVPMMNRYLGFDVYSLTNCSNGEFIVVGMTSFDITAVRIPWLEWNETLSDVLAEYATPLSIDLNATCSQGIGLWSVNDTVSFSIDSQGLLMNTGILDVGQYPLEIVVNDTLGNQLIQRFTVTVEDTTAPTWLQAPGTVFLEAGDAFYYDLNATDASGTLLWSLNAPYTFAITQAGVITNTMELAVGTYLIEVHVQDASGNTLTGTVTLQVDDTLNPVYVLPPSNQVVPYGQVIEFDIVAYDISGIATWSQNSTDFTMLLDPEGPVTTAHFTSIGILAPDTYYIAMVIADSSANALEDVLWITVTEEDVLPPGWTEEPETQNVEFGDSFSYDLNATDSSGLDHWWLGDDTYFSIDGTGLITETAPLAVGVYTITVFVNDTLGNTLSCSILVLVSDTTAPVWATTPVNQTILEDEPLDYQLSASDFSGLSSWQVNDTARFSIDSQGHLRNIVSLNPGVYWVYITVCDIYGNDLSTSISITVWKSTETITTTTGTTTTSSTLTEGVLSSIQIILIGLGSGIGSAALVLIIYAIVKRR